MDQGDILLGCARPRATFLETVQDIDRLLKAHCVDGPERIATMLLDQLEDHWPFTLPRLDGRWHTAVLDDAQGIPESSTTSPGNAGKSLFDEPTQWRGFSVVVADRAMPYYCIRESAATATPSNYSHRVRRRLYPLL
jgi:hypothetical protein